MNLAMRWRPRSNSARSRAAWAMPMGASMGGVWECVHGRVRVSPTLRDWVTSAICVRRSCALPSRPRQ